MDRFDEAFYVAALLFCLSSGVDILSGLMVDRNNQYLPLSGETGGGNCETNQELKKMKTLKLLILWVILMSDVNMNYTFSSASSAKGVTTWHNSDKSCLIFMHWLLNVRLRYRSQ